MSDQDLELRAAAQARADAYNASRPAITAARVAAAAALAEQQLQAAWGLARKLSKESDGNLNYQTVTGIAVILNAVVTNMENDHA